MIITKGIRFKTMLTWTGPHFLWLILFMASIATLYYFNVINFRIPWVPVSVIGTAVAFFVGLSSLHERSSQKNTGAI